MRLKRILLNTLAYSDIFDFPLTQKELWQYLMVDSGEKITYAEFRKELQQLSTYVSKIDTYYFLKGIEEIVKKRKQRKKVSLEKLLSANNILTIIKKIPTIDLIAISGSLAMENADTKDDIDLFIITHEGTIWFTRLIALFLLELLGVRRKRKNNSAENKICLNMFIDKKQLTLPITKQTFYTAHEITQMKVIYNRKNTYNEFLSANAWVKQFLPNTLVDNFRSKKKNRLLELLVFPWEKLSELLQKKYMHKKLGKEIITNTLLAFHPIDREAFIQKELKKRIKQYDI